MNVKDMILSQPMEDVVRAFIDRLRAETEQREKAIQRMTKFVLSLRDIEPCESGHLLLGIYHFDDDGEFLDPCLYSKKELLVEFEPESELSQLKSLAEIDSLEDEELDRLAHFKSRPESYSFILSPWNEILGYEVNSHNVQDVGAAALCAEVLYEMTFFGFEEEKVEAEHRQLHETMRKSEEIRKLPEEDQKKHFIPAEELFAKLGLPERAKNEEQSEQRRLCREVLTNKIRTHHALLKYCFGEKNVKSFKTLR